MATLTIKHAPQATVNIFGRVLSTLAGFALSFATAHAVIKEVGADNRLSPRGRELLGLDPQR